MEDIKVGAKKEYSLYLEKENNVFSLSFYKKHQDSPKGHLMNKISFTNPFNKPFEKLINSPEFNLKIDSDKMIFNIHNIPVEINYMKIYGDKSKGFLIERLTECYNKLTHKGEYKYYD